MQYTSKNLLDIRKKFFIVRVVRQRSSETVPREAVDGPSLSMFKARMSGILGNVF